MSDDEQNIVDHRHMKILSIETSCDETAVCIINAEGGLESPSFKILGNALFSQIDIHKEYGGVYPMIAKREHGKKLIPLLEKALEESKIITEAQGPMTNGISESTTKEISKILEREEYLKDNFIDFAKKYEKPSIDVISVTAGPGLAPALWVGISFAEALGKIWNIPVVPANHMEGHIASVLLNKTEEFSISNFQFPKNTNSVESEMQFPAIALLISGGHTELVEMQGWGQYKILGKTLDDAVGEAFDKVARMLGLPYPGGPQISALAEKRRQMQTGRRPDADKIQNTNSNETSSHLVHVPSASGQHLQSASGPHFPRPMIHSNDMDFSFSGLKTAVLYYLRDNFSESTPPTPEQKADIAREFEDTVVDVLLTKTKKALDESGASTLIIAGGVIANKKIRQAFKKLEEEYSGLILKIPTNEMATDNALMIACATYLNVILHPEILTNSKKIIAEGNLSLSTKAH